MTMTCSITDISSTKNDRIKTLLKFRNKNGKTSDNEMLIEGARELERALKAGITIKEIFFCHELIIRTEEKELLKHMLELNVEAFQTTKDIFTKIAYKNNPFGIIAKATFTPLKPEELTLPTTPLILVGEAIEKPGNLGALIRTADGAGVDSVILSDKKTDFRNPNTLRASTGTLFSVNFAEGDTASVIKYLKTNNIKIVAADPYGKHLYSDIDYTQSIAVVVGSEDKGLSQLYKQEADYLVQIPMMGYADSLNVNQAATIVLYEALRQRLLHKK